MNRTLKPIIILDNGHGADTAGKRSPDGRLEEWAYTRDIVRRTDAALRERGCLTRILVPETGDVPLGQRVERANRVCRDYGGHALLVSIHCNAAGNGAEWMAARGWSVHLAPGASSKSRCLAASLAAAAQAGGLTVRRPRPAVPYWTQSLAICRNTRFPAVLTENLFQDNREDVAFLLSEEGREAIVRLHVEGILRYLEGKEGAV